MFLYRSSPTSTLKSRLNPSEARSPASPRSSEPPCALKTAWIAKPKPSTQNTKSIAQTTLPDKPSSLSATLKTATCWSAFRLETNGRSWLTRRSAGWMCMLSCKVFGRMSTRRTAWRWWWCLGMMWVCYRNGFIASSKRLRIRIKALQTLLVKVGLKDVVCQSLHSVVCVMSDVVL